MLDVGSVADAHGELIELIAMVSCEVLKGFIEQCGVEEGDDATVQRDDLRALVGDGVHFTSDAVAFDVIAHAQTSCHERQSVDEVLDDVLHGETDTGGQTCRHDGDARFRYFQEDEDEDEEPAPYEDGDEVVRQSDVGVSVDDGMLHAVMLVNRFQSIADVAADEEGE